MSVTLLNEPSSLRMDEAGAIRIGSTRVMLETLVAAFHQGATPEQIVRDYPALQLADVYSAISYYLRHRGELDAYLGRRENEAEELRRAHPKLYAQGVRERLMARRVRQGQIVRIPI